ncbi:putative motility protein [Clostridium fermenticellae]|uniref:Putative motility protein n=1 Tax=Clostridium fermenticellae TaxID=2068654 RepID=A0A386H4Q2_9CLOT|nr:YjfB family protein [Clostridium fermenticellae]AYD40699.1 putative motility protein [Clostridium fermenticellae]
MDIPALSVAMSQSSLMNSVGISVAKMAINAQEQVGQEMTQMMSQSVDYNIGQNFDSMA